MKRNLSIELVKFFFAISIALGHFSSSILSGSLVVMLFFALSGYFLVSSFDSGKYSGAWQFSFSRIRRIYPYYIFAFLVSFLLANTEFLLNPIRFFERLFLRLPEILLLQNVGIVDGGINYPLWQLCTLIVASHIFFSLLEWNRSCTLNVICPVLALCVFTYLSNVYNSGTPNEFGVIYHFIYVPLLRAAAGLSVGMFVHHPIKSILAHLERSSSTRLPTLVFMASLVAISAFIANRESYVAIIPFFMLITCMLYSKGIYARLFQLPILARLDKLSLAVYLNHALIIRVINKLSHVPSLAFIRSNAVYLPMLLVYSVIMLCVVDFLTARIKRGLLHKT